MLKSWLKILNKAIFATLKEKYATFCLSTDIQKVHRQLKGRLS